MKWIIKDKKTGAVSEPFGIEWLLFGESDLQFNDECKSSLPLKDFKFFFDDFEMQEEPVEIPDAIKLLQQYFELMKKAEDEGHFDYLLQEAHWMDQAEGIIKAYE